MHKTAIGFAVGKLLQIMGGLLLVPLAIAFWDFREEGIYQILSHPDVYGFLIAAGLAITIGGISSSLMRSGRHLQGVREGLAIVTFGWLALAFFSAVPFFCWFMRGELAGQYTAFSAFTDAYFEVMSGFTTTGATILTNIESVPRSLLFLRSLTHWLGGMGIITLALVIFPGMGVTAYQMFKGEVPGPSKDKIMPRLSQTSSILWGVYGFFTAAQAILLIIGGMTPFEAVCHSFATMATGGFSTANDSVAAFSSDFIRWVIIIFMYFAGVNFLLHFRALRGDISTMFRDKEFLFYNSVIAATIIIVTCVLYFHGLAPIEVAADHYRSTEMTTAEFAAHYAEQAAPLSSLYETFRIASFQTLAIVTTTGFATVDFDLWPDVLRLLMIFLMFFGGCAGSTGGGMKMVRIMIVFRVLGNVIRKRSQPKLVAPVKIGDHIVDDTRVVNVLSFFILFLGLFILVGLAMTLFVPDLTTAVACSIATIGNIGPGLAGIGAIENYGWIPLPGKWLLVFSMLLGRLEIFTVLICLRPAVWRK
ncbi:MAG: TrkH family potassium uptake protein [candidate division Zixibacteria bacterium]